MFNYTQPAEDAVDEAESGLKSSLAVKIFGGDLQTLEDKGEAVRRLIAKVPGITEITVVRELGQPSLVDHARPRKDRPLRPQRRRHQHDDRDRGRRHSRRRRWSRASGSST